MTMTAEPYRDAQSHLDDHLARIARVLDGCTADVLVDIDRRIAAREHATRIALPLRVLRDRGELDQRAIKLLVLAAVPALDAELTARLRERIRGSAPTVGELFAILGIPASEADASIAALVAGTSRVAHGLVVASAGDATPTLERRLYVDARVAAFLRGDGLFEQVPAARSPGAIPDSVELQIRQVLSSPPSPNETIETGFRRKEHELRALFAVLTPVEARALHRRLANPSFDDVIAMLFARLVIDRRGRLLAFLAQARRRYALISENQRSSTGGR